MRDRGAAKITRFVTGLLLAVALAAMGAPASAVDIKIATVAPDGSRWMQQMRAGAEEYPREPAVASRSSSIPAASWVMTRRSCARSASASSKAALSRPAVSASVTVR